MVATRRRFLKLASMACAAIGIVPKVAATPKRYFIKATHEELIGMRFVSNSLPRTASSGCNEYQVIEELGDTFTVNGELFTNRYRNKFWVSAVDNPGASFLICLQSSKAHPEHFDLSPKKDIPEGFYK